MTTPSLPTLTLRELADRIGLDAAFLQKPLLPAEGLRVWGDTGVATVHHDGQIQLAVIKRRIHTVVCDDHPDSAHFIQRPGLGRYAGICPKNERLAEG